MPFSVGALPVDYPSVAFADIGDFGDGLLDPLSGMTKVGPNVEKFDGLSFKALAVPDLISEARWRAMLRPESVFKGLQV